jgi:hypothetical protein
MHSEPCCEGYLNLAESKSIDVRAGQESALVYLMAEQKIQEILFAVCMVAIACPTTVPCWDVPCRRQICAPLPRLAPLPPPLPRRTCSPSFMWTTERTPMNLRCSHFSMHCPLSAPFHLFLLHTSCLTNKGLASKVHLYFHHCPRQYIPRVGSSFVPQGRGIKRVGGVEVSPSTKTSSRGRSTSPASFLPKTAGSAQ